LGWRYRWHFILFPRFLNPGFRHGSFNFFEYTGALEELQVPSVAEVLERITRILNADFLDIGVGAPILKEDIVEFSAVTLTLEGL
jgi:hypothetical protein